jgi:integrase
LAASSTPCRAITRSPRRCAPASRRRAFAEDREGFLFRTARGYNGVVLSDKATSQPDAWRMIRRRAAAAGIAAPIGYHTFRATGITAYLANGGALEDAQEMAAHESPRTTKLYDRTKDRLTRDEVERIRL